MFTAALALSAGEDFPEILSAVEAYPSLDVCGIARSVPDLLRLLSLFRPSILIASSCILEEFVQEGLLDSGVRYLSAPVTFILLDGKEELEGIELSRIMRLPLRIGGAIERETRDIESVFQYIKSKVDVYSYDDTGQRTPHIKSNPKCGLFIFSGSKGGVGNTLISCSFAAIASAGKRALLMELGGKRSQLTHIKASLEGKTLSELLPLAEEISWDLLRMSLFRHDSGFYLLPLERRNVKGHAFEPRRITPLLRNLLFLFDIVVVDLQTPWNGEFPVLMPFLPVVLLVTLPDVLSTACARDAAEFMRRNGMDTSHMHLLINRNGGNHILGMEELARATGLQIAASLPDDARSGLDFSELGEIPRPDSTLGRAVASLAFTLGLTPSLPSGAGIRERPSILAKLRGKGLRERMGGGA